MALILQNATGSQAGANAYATYAEFTAWHDERGIDYSSFDQTGIEQAIIRATDFLDQRYPYLGKLYVETQTTAWPRSGVYSPGGTLLAGLPLALKRATFELAFRALSGPLWRDAPTDESGRIISRKKEKVGPLEEETEYADGGSAAPAPSFPAVERLLKQGGLISSFGTGTDGTLWRH
jgi:hypothetical protein